MVDRALGEPAGQRGGQRPDDHLHVRRGRLADPQGGRGQPTDYTCDVATSLPVPATASSRPADPQPGHKARQVPLPRPWCAFGHAHGYFAHDPASGDSRDPLPSPARRTQRHRSPGNEATSNPASSESARVQGLDRLASVNVKQRFPTMYNDFPQLIDAPARSDHDATHRDPPERPASADQAPSLTRRLPIDTCLPPRCRTWTPPHPSPLPKLDADALRR